MEATTIAELDARMERMERALDRVVGLLDQVQPNVAMAVDIADEWVTERVGGDGVEARLSATLDAVEALTEPAVVQALARLARKSPELDALAEVLQQPAPPLGVMGLLSALGDPAVQRGVGRVVQLTRHLGQLESTTSTHS